MTSLAVGFFDGVHLGHQAILKGADAALTFRNHPLTVLAPEKAPRLIMTPEDRIAAIRACGVKDVMVLEFTPELAEMPAETFASRRLSSPIAHLPSMIRCGENWRFGKGGAGDAAFLRKCGFAVEVAPYVEYRGERVSSSRIRAALENGEIEDANAMMGRRFKVQGSRVKGKGLGEKIGYPTVNLEISERESRECGESSRIRLRCGVYEVEVGDVRGIANYGFAPTMGDRAWRTPVLEVHFPCHQPSDLDLRPSIPVFLVRFVRPEREFASTDDLKRQIAADVSHVFQSHG